MKVILEHIFCDGSYTKTIEESPLSPFINATLTVYNEKGDITGHTTVKTGYLKAKYELLKICKPQNIISFEVIN